MEKQKFKNNIIYITYGVVLFVLLTNYHWIFDGISNLTKIFMPFIIGIFIAFILNVLVKVLENTILLKLNKFKRVLSVTISLFLIIGFIVFMLFILIPQVKNAGKIFVDNIPEYQHTIYEFGKKAGIAEEKLEVIDLSNNRIKDEITNLVSNNKKLILDISFGFASSLASTITNTVIGLIFAIYILLDKENLRRQFGKLLRKIFKKDKFDKIKEVVDLSDEVFTNYTKVQTIEAIILGVLCFIGMLIFRFPYAATISVFVGFTALVPIFGSFVGCFIGAFLIFMIDPLESLTFIIFFMILQQIEGNLIYPRVVGGKIGLPSIWVLVAVTVGGSIGGVFGMLLGVPIVSIVYSLTKKFVNKTS